MFVSVHVHACVCACVCIMCICMRVCMFRGLTGPRGLRSTGERWNVVDEEWGLGRVGGALELTVEAAHW